VPVPVLARVPVRRSRRHQPGYDPRADVTGDGVVNIKDLAYVSQRITVGVRCSGSTEPP
jgi:hypothetical protein